ncbi:vacuolating cytotoxin domain-containing protein [Helicobacter suis]|uniref:vacuolating cytotoxin domain-containing protein n=1 Tax=Helicobacter suis TaxID=104628 RepID=UPI0013D85F7F|nr:vacuolating cytotoxin domain-containing protein [Helicobacter suis]
MKKFSSLTLKFGHALARRIKANQARRAGTYVFKKQLPLPKRSELKPKLLKQGTFILGVMSQPLLAWYPSWISGSHTLNTTDIKQYMQNNHRSQNLLWTGGSNVFYEASNGSYFCTNWNCNGSVTLIGNGSTAYTLSNLNYEGGSLNLQINGNGTQGTLNISNVNMDSYQGRQFTDTWNAQKVNISGNLQVGQNHITIHANNGTTANNATINADQGNGVLNINDSTSESFTNTTFKGTGQINLQSNNIIFNNVTFNDSNTSSHVTDNGTLTLEGTETFAQNSPLINLGANVTIQANTIFNITEDLTKTTNGAYNLDTLVSTSGNKSINDSSYVNHLWDLIRYQGQTGSLFNGQLSNGTTLSNPSSGNGIYYVKYTFGNGDWDILKEDFENNSLSAQLEAYAKNQGDIWGTIHNINSTWNFNVGEGSAYINPGNGVDQAWAQSNKNFKVTLDNGNGGTLILGNSTENPSSSGKILFGGTGGNPFALNGNYGGDLGYMTGEFDAGKIYLTGTIESGNSFHDGNGTNINYNAITNITANGLHYLNDNAGAWHSNANFKATNGSINISNSQFQDQSSGQFTFNSQNQTFNSTIFTGNSYTITLHATNNLTLTNTSFNDSNATLTLEADNASLQDSTNQGTSQITAKQLNIIANQASFSNTIFNANNSSFKTNQLTLTNDTFNNGSYSFTSESNNNSHTTTFGGTTTINTSSSPFANLGGSISFNSGATFNLNNILSSLQIGTTYTILGGSGASINYSSDTQYASNLWNLIKISGTTINSETEISNTNGTQVWDVIFGINGMPIKIQETFANNELSFKVISQAKDIWSDVYTMTPGCAYNVFAHNCTYGLFHTGFKTYNESVGADGIAYINPLNPQSHVGYNASTHTLQTYTKFGNGGIYNVGETKNGKWVNNGTLILGNNTLQATTGGKIEFGAVGSVGYITDVFNAGNVFLTNTIEVGDSSLSGAGATLTFNANNNITADGLTYHQDATAIPPFGSAISQHSHGSFNAQNSFSALNSSFEDDTSGSLDFTGKNNISFTNSTVIGSASSITLNSAKTTLNNSAFFVGNGTTLTFGNVISANGHSGYSTSTNTINNSTINLNQNSNLQLHGNTTLDNTTSFLNLGSQATFYGSASLSGSTTINLDHNSKITMNSTTTLNDNANFNLINSAQANFQNNTTFNNSSGITLNSGAKATFMPTTTSTQDITTFNNNSFLNVNGSFTDFIPNTSSNGSISGGGSSSNQNYSAQFNNLVFNNYASMLLNSADIQSSQTTFANSVNINMQNSLFNAGTLNLNGGNFYMQNSQIKAGAVSVGASDSVNINSGVNSLNRSLITSSSFNLDGTLNLDGLLLGPTTTGTTQSAANSQPLISVSSNGSSNTGGGTFNLNGILNISNIDLSAPLSSQTNNTSSSATYDIVNANNITGMSGANGYQKIEYYGIKINNATYSDTNNIQSWSFTNPLDGAQTITEKIQNGKLTITISNSDHFVATDYHNIAPELFFYKQSAQNLPSTDSASADISSYDYSSDESGTFFLDGNLKGVYYPKASTTGTTSTPVIPGTYNAQGQPLQGLYISNNGLFNATTLNNLVGIVQSIWPHLKTLLPKILADLSDPSNIIQDLENSGITLTPTRSKELLSFIDGLSSNINQTFNNGTLVVGSPQAGQTGSSSVVWFGGNGYTTACTAAQTEKGCQDLRGTYLGQLLGSTSAALGYIEANFKAKDIYITGTVGSGNAWGIGGSADVTFNSATNLTLNQATIDAEGTDQIFNMLGEGGIQKILGQKGLAQMLGNYIYDLANGSSINLDPTSSIPSSIQPLAKDLGGQISKIKLSEVLSASDVSALLNMPGMDNVIKNILSTKTVSSLLGSGGLISSLNQAEQNKIYDAIDKELHFSGGKAIASIANGVYGNHTLLSLINSLSPMTGKDVNNILNMPNTSSGQSQVQNFLNNTTFGQIFEELLSNQNLLNKTIAWLGPQILDEMLKTAIDDLLNPTAALTAAEKNMLDNILNNIFGSEKKAVQQMENSNPDIKQVINGLMQAKGLGEVYTKGLQSILSNKLQDQLKSMGLGSLLAPKALGNFWQKGYFNFLANDDILVSNSTFSNASGGTLSFIAGKSIIFAGQNTINFSNSQGTLEFLSNDVSNIDLTTLNATDGLTIDAPFNNLYVQKGNITLNQYESFSVQAGNFDFLGTVQADGAVDLSGVTGLAVLGTLNLTEDSTLKANNLTTISAFNNQSLNLLNISGNFNSYGTFSTQGAGVNIGGGFNSTGALTFNVAGAAVKTTGPSSDSSSSSSSTGSSSSTSSSNSNSSGDSSASSSTSTASTSSSTSTSSTTALTLANTTTPTSSTTSNSTASTSTSSSSTSSSSDTSNSPSSNSASSSGSNVNPVSPTPSTQIPLIQVGGLVNLNLGGNAIINFNTEAQANSTGSTGTANTSTGSSAGSSSTSTPQTTTSSSTSSTQTASTTPSTTLSLSHNTSLATTSQIPTTSSGASASPDSSNPAASPITSPNGAYTLIQTNSWIHYNPTSFNPNNWRQYLELYTSLKINGTAFQLNAQGTGLTYNGQAVNISQRGLLVNYQGANGQEVSASIDYNKIQIGIGQSLQVIAPTITQYITQIQGQSVVNALENAGGAGVMNWFGKLLIETKNTPLFAPYYLEQHSLSDLLKIVKDIQNATDWMGASGLKATSSKLLQISVHTKQMSRLAKLSNFASNDELPDFHDFLVSLKGKKFASAVPNAMDIITAYSQRDKLKNNLWVTGVGGASFVAGGTGTLYGLNVGYDRFIKGVIVGGYMAYGYSGFYGNINSANSNNVNVGFYSRAFIKGRNEITGSVNETYGYNKTYIDATNPILTPLNQQYHYSTWTTNIGANYGYDFFFKNKHVILKPQIGLTYYYIGLSGLQGKMNDPIYNEFRANADPAHKSVLTINLALESRHYFRKNSYYYVIAGLGRDLFVHSMGDKMVRFIGNDMLSYRYGGMYNTFASLTTGGEVRLFRSFYINAGIGARFGLDYQDINITGNVGMRYAF